MILVGARTGAAVALGGDTFHWRARDESIGLRLSGRELRTLDACRPFLPRDEHVARIAHALDEPFARAARTVDSLIEQGALFDPVAWLASGAAEPAPRAPDPLVVVRTYRRPESLERLCESLLADERRLDARRRYLFVDDDVDADRSARNAAIVDAFARASRSMARFLGAARREAMIETFARAVPHGAHDVLRELLDPARAKAATGGRSWNWALLAAAGGTLSIVDDDLAFPMRTFPGAPRPFELRNSIASAVRYLDEPAYDAFPLLREDPFAYAAASLGQPARATLRERRFDASALRGRDAREVDHLGPRARIAAAFGGVYNSLAFDSSVVLHLGDRESLEHLFRAPFRLERLACETTFYGVPAPRLTSYATYTPLGIDCRELVPFVTTLSSSDDTSFLAMVKALAPESVFHYLDASVGHFQVEARGRLAAASGVLELRHGLFVAQTLADSAVALRSADRAKRLDAIGALASDLLAADDATLAEEITRWRHKDYAMLAERLAGQLAAYPDAPDAWREIVATALEAHRAALDSTEVDDNELDLLRGTLHQVATGARFWPALFDFAREARPLESLV